MVNSYLQTGVNVLCVLCFVFVFAAGVRVMWCECESGFICENMKSESVSNTSILPRFFWLIWILIIWWRDRVCNIHLAHQTNIPRLLNRPLCLANPSLYPIHQYLIVARLRPIAQSSTIEMYENSILLGESTIASKVLLALPLFLSVKSLAWARPPSDFVRWI